MSHSKPISAAVVVALLALAGGTSGAAAYERDTTHRVVDVAGSDVLNIRLKPHHRAPVLYELAFDARGIEVISGPRNGWVKVRVSDERGREQIGWVNAKFLAIDTGEPTLYRPLADRHGAPLALEVRKRRGFGRSVGFIPGHAEGIRATGPCEDGWCRISWKQRWRWLVGWVEQSRIAVIKTEAEEIDADQSGHVDEGAAWKDDGERPRKRRWKDWRPEEEETTY